MEAPSQRHPLAAVRAARGWSYQDLVEEVAAHSRLLGVPMAARREKAWRWENWGVVPDADSQRALALALGVDPARMTVRPWPGWLPTGTDLPSDLPWTPAGSLTALQDLLADIEEDHRGFAIASPAVLADALAAWYTPSTAWLGNPLECTCQDPGVTDDGITVWLRTYALTLPPLLRAIAGADPRVLRRKLDGDLRLIAELLIVGAAGGRAGSGGGAPASAENGRASAVLGGAGRGLGALAVTRDGGVGALPVAVDGHPRPELFQAAAKIALISARHSVRAALHGPAQRYLFTALRCTHSAADPATAATTLATVGRHLATLGDPSSARRFRALAAAVRNGERESQVSGVAA